jgi:hypothetical protein
MYGGYYGGWDYYDDDWAEAMVVGAVVVGSAAAIAESEEDDEQEVATSSMPSQLPCEPIVHDVKGVKYYQCNAQYFVEVFGGSGPMFMPVAPPQLP